MSIGPRKVAAFLGTIFAAGALALAYAIGGDTALLVGIGALQLAIIVAVLDTRVHLDRHSERRRRTVTREISKVNDRSTRLTQEVGALRGDIDRDQRQRRTDMDRQLDDTRRAIGQAQDRTRSHTRAVLRDQYLQIEALLALYHDLQPKHAFPPLRTWVASPDLLHYVYRRISRDMPNCILELGSGVSTVVMAYALQRVGHGRLVALEHDEHYRLDTAAQLEEHGLSDWVDLRLAPLEPVEIEGEAHVWYARSALPSGPIDMVLVDGPPGDTQTKARYPAVPLTHSLLAKDAIVILDDYDREDEQEVAVKWVEMYPDFTLSRVAHEKGTAILEAGI